jgi:hypothetical protein
MSVSADNETGVQGRITISISLSALRASMNEPGAFPQIFKNGEQPGRGTFFWPAKC